MKLEQIVDVVTKHLGGRKDGAAYLLPADAETTIFVSLTGETLAVPKVGRIEVDGSLLVLDTQKGDRIVIGVEDVRAIKVDRGDGRSRDRSAGFGAIK